MEKDEVKTVSEPKDVVGNHEKNTFQTLRRVSIPPDFKDQMGVEVGDELFILCKDDSVEVFVDIDKMLTEKEKLEDE